MTVPAVKPTRKPQIRPALASAIAGMVERGLSISEAAESSGLQYESLRTALKRPHVSEYVTSQRHAWLSGQTLKSWVKVAHLRDSADSQKVQLESAQTFIKAAGELEPHRDPGPVRPLAIQFVINAPVAGAGSSVISNGGVVEARPFDPATYRPPLPLQEDVEDGDAED